MTQLYLSLDKVFDATSDLPLTPLKLYSPDNPSAGFLQPPYNRSGIFQLPKGFVGQYYVIFVTDVLDDVVEFNSEQDSEANNVLCHPIPVTLELPHTTDLILESVTVATSIGLGETLNVSYTIKNSSTEDIDYYWTDAVYLSADSTLDSTDRLLTKVPQSGLAAVSRRPMSVPAVVSGVPEGDYYIIVVADVYDQIDEGDGELTNRVSSDSMVQVQVQNLRLGTWVADSFTPLRERYYRLDTGEELDLLFTLDSDSTTASNELFVRRGTPPDRGHYDYRYPAMGQPDRRSSFPTPRRAHGTSWLTPKGSIQLASASERTCCHSVCGAHAQHGRQPFHGDIGNRWSRIGRSFSVSNSSGRHRMDRR